MQPQYACRGTLAPGQSAARPARWSACPHQKLPWTLPCGCPAVPVRPASVSPVPILRHRRFCFQKQLVTRSLFCFVGVQVDLAHEIAFIQRALAALQRLNLLLIFGAFRYGSICPERTVRGKRRGGFHLLFQRQEYRLFQLRGVQTHFVAAAFFVRFGMAAVIIRGFLHGAGQRMTAAAAEGFAFQRVIPLFLLGWEKRSWLACTVSNTAFSTMAG